MLRHWQLFAAAVWAVLAAGILFRGSLFQDDVIARLPVRNWTVATFICGFLAVWNVARWYGANAARREVAVRAAMQPRADAPRGYEYNPELDFQKMDREKAEGGG